MTVRINRIGEPPEHPYKPKEYTFTPQERTFRCTVCKCQCVITMAIHTEGVKPRWCPMEPDETNLRYADWEEGQ